MPRVTTPHLVAWMLARSAGATLDSRDDVPWSRDDSDVDREVRWIANGGLGPLLRHVANGNGVPLPARWQAPLLSADLTARVRHASFVAAAADAIDACRECGVMPLLLKGISTSGQWYPLAHLRPMGDVDILVPADAHGTVEEALQVRGFIAMGSASLHHGAPLRHPTSGIEIEVHKNLFGSDSILSVAATFARERVMSETVASRFEGRPVLRLSPETQLVYIASSLMADLIRHGVDPTFLPTLADVVLLLHASAGTLRWERVCASLENPLARASTCLLLDYLAGRGLADVPGDALAWLRRGPGPSGAIQRAAFRFLMNRYFVGGRRWDLPVPPPVPGRYSLRRQFENRILRKRRGILELS